MPSLLKIRGVSNVVANLTRLEKKSRREDNVAVIVGYTANYALPVHETHREKSKFLETPAREMEKELMGTITTIRRKTGSMLQGLMVAGLSLQRESQKRVPVDTGNLKGSAFTRKE